MPPQVFGSYQIDGARSSGDDYIAAIERSGTELDVITFTRADSHSLVVGTGGDDLRATFGRVDADGIEWDSLGTFSRAETLSMVAGFITDDGRWDRDLEWIQSSISSAEQRRRLIPLVIIGITLIFLALGFLHD